MTIALCGFFSAFAIASILSMIRDLTLASWNATKSLISSECGSIIDDAVMTCQTERGVLRPIHAFKMGRIDAKLVVASVVNH